MKTIICAVDGSPGGVQALRVASQMSDAFGLRLVLAHVAAGQRSIDGRTGGDKLGRQAAEHVLEQAAHAAGVGSDADRRAEAGERGSTLARVAAEEAAAVLVLGSRTQGHARRRRLLGSLAGELNATAPCPVLVVPPPARR